jgi:tetratricopeptide (TPR) repeat protein
MTLSTLLRESGHFEEAISNFEKSMKLKASLGGPTKIIDKLSSQKEKELMIAQYRNVGRQMNFQEKFNQSSEYLNKALKLAKEVYKEAQNHKILEIKIDLIDTLQKSGDIARSEEMFEEIMGSL